MGKKKPQRIRCAHCQRRRLARFMEWHPGIEAWQCKADVDKCDELFYAIWDKEHRRK